MCSSKASKILLFRAGVLISICWTSAHTCGSLEISISDQVFGRTLCDVLACCSDGCTGVVMVVLQLTVVNHVIDRAQPSEPETCVALPFLACFPSQPEGRERRVDRSQLHLEKYQESTYNCFSPFPTSSCRLVGPHPLHLRHWCYLRWPFPPQPCLRIPHNILLLDWESPFFCLSY